MFPQCRFLRIVALTLAVVSRAHSEETPAELLQYKTQHQKEVDFALRPLRERYLSRLETLKRTFAQKGDVRAAVTVQDEIDLQSAILNEAVIIAKHVGMWNGPAGANRRYAIKADATVQWVYDNGQVYTTGHMVRNGKDFTFVWDGADEICRLTFTDTGMILEAFAPKGSYPAGPVSTKINLIRTAVVSERPK
jgi:hypothetical protein